jgi:hypothetical protein
MPPASTIQFVDRYASFIDLLLAGSETRLKRDYTRSESRRCRRIPCLLADLGNNTGLKIVQSVAPPLHHSYPFVAKLRAGISAADGVALDVGKLRFDRIWIP